MYRIIIISIRSFNSGGMFFLVTGCHLKTGSFNVSEVKFAFCQHANSGVSSLMFVEVVCLLYVVLLRSNWISELKLPADASLPLLVVYIK
jgi:hypothetical protein